jgi:polysaccharide export outer membrane protein
MFVCVSLYAQTGLIQRPPAAPEYVLQPGDQLSLHVIDVEEIPDKPIRLDSTGFVDIPLAGRFRASGFTVEEFKTLLASRLSRYISDPQITASLTEDQSRPVSVIGSVNAPGIHNLSGPKRLVDVISLAGGVKGDAGSRVIVTREQKWGKIPVSGSIVDPPTGSSTATLSLDDLISLKDPSQNIWIEPNDVVSIPHAEIVYVVGNVKKAGGFQLSTHPSISVVQALSLAEGLDKDAAPGRAKIIRETPGGDGRPAEIPVDIKGIFEGKLPDIALRGNDILFIPNSAAKSASRRTVEAILQAATGAAIYRF